MRERKTLTKEWLQSLGITNVTEKGEIYIKGHKAYIKTAKCPHKISKKVKEYPCFSIYDKELRAKQKEENKIPTGMRGLIVSRVVYAWFHDICPADLDVDHIDNNPFNNNVNNLQLLNRKDNNNKHAPRNQYNFHLTDEEIKKHIEEVKYYKIKTDEARAKIKEQKEKISKLKEEYVYYLNLCKDPEKCKIYNANKDLLYKQIQIEKMWLKEYNDNWHR